MRVDGSSSEPPRPSPPPCERRHGFELAATSRTAFLRLSVTGVGRSSTSASGSRASRSARGRELLRSFSPTPPPRECRPGLAPPPPPPRFADDFASVAGVGRSSTRASGSRASRSAGRRELLRSLSPPLRPRECRLGLAPPPPPPRSADDLTSPVDRSPTRGFSRGWPSFDTPFSAPALRWLPQVSTVVQTFARYLLKVLHLDTRCVLPWIPDGKGPLDGLGSL
jgi:hypothetical protein